MYEELMKDRTPTLVEEQGNFFIRSRKEERKLKDTSYIWRTIIGLSHIKLIELTNLLWKDDSELIGVKTDCVLIKNPSSNILNTCISCSSFNEDWFDDYEPTNYSDCEEELEEKLEIKYEIADEYKKHYKIEHKIIKNKNLLNAA